MSEYQERKKTRQRQTSEAQETVSEGDGQAQAVSEETDDLLDEIDAVLEENAEQFVRQYVQKGGE